MSPPEPTASTRDRILAAAREEFAERGIAGARIDRIAAAARTSKERVYAHFRSKDELYAVLTHAELTEAMDAATLDPADLPAYVGALFDHYASNPQHLRLLAWGRLEGPAPIAATSDDPVRLAIDRKLGVLRAAQADGLLDDALEPVEVMMLVNQLATAWLGSVELHDGVDAHDPTVLARRRDAVVTAARRVFAPGR